MTVHLTKTQVMELVASGKCHESFSHEHLGIYDVTLMREYCIAKKLEVHEHPLERESIDFIRKNRDVDEDRVFELTDEQLEDPALLIAFDDGTHLLVDGTHRIIGRWEDGKKTYKFWVIHESEAIRPPEDWGDFSAARWGQFHVADGKVTPHE